MTDTIAQLVTSLKNAAMASHKEVQVPASGFKQEIIQKLSELGYVTSVNQYKEKGRLYLKVGIGQLQDIKRVSKPSRRKYVKAKKISRYAAKRSKLLISTPQGLLFDHEAAKRNLGGEVILEIT